MFARLLLAGVLAMTLVTFSPGANAKSGEGDGHIFQGITDISQGRALVAEGRKDLHKGQPLFGLVEYRLGVGLIREGWRILVSPH